MFSENIITSKDNPTIKLYHKLATSKKERLNYKLFVIEGLRIVVDAINENVNITHILVTESAKAKIYNEFLQVDLKATKLLVISNELGKKISQTENTQGVFAICSMPLSKEAITNENGKYIILHELQDPGNLGMIIRTADALGIDGLVLCNCCDLYCPKVVRATMGSIFRLNINIINNIDSIFEKINSLSLNSCATILDKTAVNINTIDFSLGTAVFIGNEGNGLPYDVAEKCLHKVIIPMNGNINSLNAAMAAGIIMWELKRCD